MDVLTLVCDV